MPTNAGCRIYEDVTTLRTRRHRHPGLRGGLRRRRRRRRKRIGNMGIRTANAGAARSTGVQESSKHYAATLAPNTMKPLGPSFAWSSPRLRSCTEIEHTRRENGEESPQPHFQPKSICLKVKYSPATHHAPPPKSPDKPPMVLEEPPDWRRTQNTSPQPPPVEGFVR